MTAYLDHKDLANETIDPARAREVQDGVRSVLDRVAEAERKAGREPGSVRVLAATKTRDVGEIRAALEAGIRLIGENRPQEVQIKAEPLSGDLQRLQVGYHLIGQLQRNKINKVLPWVDTIESVQSAEQGEQIAKRVPTVLGDDRSVAVFLEVNESGEESKSGCDPAVAYDQALAIARIPGLRLTGLMTIGAHVSDGTRIRQGFAALRGLRDRISASGEPGTQDCHELSMGMTHDFPLAIAEGATEVRVGTGIFGGRAFI